MPGTLRQTVSGDETPFLDDGDSLSSSSCLWVISKQTHSLAAHASTLKLVFLDDPNHCHHPLSISFFLPLFLHQSDQRLVHQGDESLPDDVLLQQVPLSSQFEFGSDDSCDGEHFPHLGGEIRMWVFSTCTEVGIQSES